MRVLEIGCGSGVAAREIANRIPNVHILAIDRSRLVIDLATKKSKEEIGSGRLLFRQVAIENLSWKKTNFRTTWHLVYGSGPWTVGTRKPVNWRWHVSPRH
jgi:ubiquinone/menaquinone biosynthesis C-methylase UbiE